MSDANTSDRQSALARNDEGVLANLPRTRPQRSSPRRAAARKVSPPAIGAENGPAFRGEHTDQPAAAGAAQAAAPATARKPARRKAPGGNRAGSAKRSGAQARRQASAPRRASVRGQDAAPRQGLESDGESLSGPVPAPGGA